MLMEVGDLVGFPAFSFICKSHLRKKVLVAVENVDSFEVGALIGFAIEIAVGTSMMTVGDAFESALGDVLGLAERVSVEMVVGYVVRFEMGDLIRYAMVLSFDMPVGDLVWFSAGALIGVKLGDRLGLEVGDSLDFAIGELI